MALKVLEGKPFFKKILTFGGVLLVFFLIVLPILSLLSSSFIVTVQSGSVKIKRRFGKVVSILDPGLHLKYPVIEDTVAYSTRKLIYEASENPLTSKADYTDYPVDTTTSDGQAIQIEYTVRFMIDPAKADWLTNNLGDEENMVERIIKMDSRIHVRGIARNYQAGDLYTGNVKQYEDEVTVFLKPLFENNALILDEFGVRAIKFSPEYIEAIETRQIEKEKVTAEKYKAEQELYKKQAKITQAEGESQAQRLLGGTLDDRVLRKLYLEKWDGKLPQMMCSDASKIIWDVGGK